MKCTHRYCNEETNIVQQIGFFGVIPLCPEHVIWLMEEAQHTQKTISRLTGQLVRINTFKDLKAQMNEDFKRFTNSALMLTSGICKFCEKEAVGTVTGLTPVCEKHMDFPRLVDTGALKETKP